MNTAAQKKGGTGGLTPRGILFAALAGLFATASTVSAEPPQFQAAGAGASGTGAVTPVWPTHQQDDIALLFVETNGETAATLSTPAGFQEVTGSPQFTGTGTTGTRLTVFWHRATSSAMGNPTVASNANHNYAVIVTFRGAINLGDPWDITGGGIKTPASVTVAAAGVTTTLEETLVVLGVATGRDGNGAFVNSQTNANLGDLAERFDNGTNSGSGGGVAVITGTKTVEGATGVTTVNMAFSFVNGYLKVALKRITAPKAASFSFTDVAARSVTGSWGLVSQTTGYTLVAAAAQADPPALTHSSDTIASGALVGSPVLTPNTTYHMYVRSNGLRQSSPWRFLTSTATLVEYPPATPAFTAVSTGSLRFSWSNNNNPLFPAAGWNNYRVQVSTASGFPASSVITSSVTYDLAVSSLALLPNVTYYFRVFGFNHNEVPTSSVESSTATLARDPVFSSFSGLSTGSVTVGWSANTNPGWTYYHVKVSTADPDSPGGAPVTETFTYANSLSTAGLAANTTYYFRIAAVNSRGVATQYILASTSTWARAPVMGAFTGGGTAGLTANWSVNNNPGGTLYRVLVSSLASFSPALTYNTFSNSLSSAGLVANTTYYFRVSAFNGVGVEAGPVEASSSTWAAAPSAPAMTGAGVNSAAFSWSPGANRSPGTLFRVLSSTSPDMVPAVSSLTYGVSLSSTGLTANTSYYFRVAAVGNGGDITAYTSDASTATWAVGPAFDAFSFVSTGSARLSWTATGNPGDTLYRAELATAEDMSGAAVYQGAVNFLAAADLAANTSYYFRVRAVNRRGVATSPLDASTATWVRAAVYDSFTLVSTGSARLNWNHDGNPADTRYRVQVSSLPGFAPGGVYDAYENFLSSAGLLSNATYYFRVTALNRRGVAAAALDASTATWARAPVFSGFGGVSTGSLQLNWNRDGGPADTLYRVQVSSLPGFSPGGTYSTYDDFFSTGGLAANTTYYFRARAVNRGGVETNYFEASTATWARAALFSSFTGVGADSAQINWEENDNPEDTLYRVQVSTAVDHLNPGGAAVTETETYDHFLSSSGLLADATYYFAVYGVNRNGVAAQRLDASTATWARPPVFTAFTALSTGSALAEWDANLNPPDTRYRVHVSTAPDPENPAGARATVADIYDTAFSSSGLSANTTYYFKVYGLNRGGVRTAGIIPATATWARAPVFSGFDGLSTGSARVSWTANDNPSGTLFRVYTSTAANPLAPAGAAVTLHETYGASVSSAGLSANTTYYFSAAAVNHNGVESAYVNPGTSTLAALPADFYFTGTSSNSIRVNWSGDTNGPGTLYRVQVSTAENIASPSGAVVTTSDTYNAYLSTAGLAPYTDYYFRALAVNNNGVFTAYSSTVSEKTLPIGQLGSPAFGSVTAVYVTSITASWSLVNGATGYTLAASLSPDTPPVSVYASSTVLGGLSATLFENSALVPDTRYYLFVRANGPGSVGDWFAYGDPVATRLAFPPVFTSFTGVGESAAGFNWDRNGNAADTTLYRVLVSTADPLAPGGAAVSSSDTYRLALTTAGLAANTTYYFRTAGVNKDGLVTAYTALQSTATRAAQPASPYFSVVVGDALELAWESGGNPFPATLYRAVISTAMNPLSPGGARATAFFTYGLSVSSSGLAPDTTYYFRVAALGHNAEYSDYTAAVSTATLADAPSFTSFTGLSTGSLQANWSGGDNPGDTLYRVYVSTAPDPEVPGGAAVTYAPGYETSFSSAGLSADTTYYFRVYGVNKNGVPTAVITPATATWARPPLFTAFTELSTGSARLGWSGNDNPADTRYRVFVSTALNPESPSGAAATSADLFETGLSSAGLLANATYYFRVYGVNRNGVLTAPLDRSTATWARAPVFTGFPAVAADSLQAGWDPGGNADGTLYRVYASTAPDPEAPGGAAATVSDTYSLSLSTSGLLPNATYYFAAYALNRGGVPSDRVDFATATWARPALGGTFSGLASAALQLAWDNNLNPPDTLYRTHISTAVDPESPSGAKATTAYTYDSSISTAGLLANATYYLRVYALNRNSVAAAVLSRSTSTLAKAPVFSAFTSVGSGAITADWDPDGNPGYTRYAVHVSTAQDPETPGGARATLERTYTTLLSTSGLLVNATYYFRFYAENNDGVLTAAVDKDTATLAAAPVFSGFGAVSTGSLRLDWLRGGSPEDTLYRVTVSSMPGLQPAADYNTYGAELSTGGLAANTTYYFRTLAFNRNGVPTSDITNSTPTWARQPLSAASTFSAVTESGFRAHWDANNNPAGTSYTVQASTAADFNGGASESVTASTVPLSGPAYTFTGLKPDTLYYFQVRAVNRGGVATNYTQLGSTRTLVLPPPAVNAVTAVTTFSVTASWNLSASATGYTLAASLNSGAAPSPMAASSATVLTAAALPGLDLNTTYYLFVRAEGAGASSSWSVFPATTTLARQPLTAITTYTAVGYTSFKVHWDANSNPLGQTLYSVQISTAYDFDPGATDAVSFDTVPVYGPAAFFENLNFDTYYYFRVRAAHSAGIYTPWTNLGVVKTKAQPVIHSAGDGVIFYGKTGTAAPQFRKYTAASNTFGAVETTLTGNPGSLHRIVTSPSQIKQEALAAYVSNGTLRVFCTDGTNWTEEWSQNIGGTDTTRRFDLAYETASGDAIVVYSQNQGTTNELGYRVKSGAADCGEGWGPHTNLDATRTSGVVQWVKLASDRRSSSDTVVAVWADAASDLSARIWNGEAWEAEPAAALETALEVAAAAQDVESFDAEFESGGDALVVWGSGGTATTNGAYYSAWNGLTRAWGVKTAITGFLNDATNLDLAANPDSDEMLFAAIGNAGSDMQAMYWSGSAWSGTATDLDATSAAPLAGNKLVAAGWLSWSGVRRGVVAYNDSATTNIGWYVWFGSSFVVQTDFTPAPAFANPQRYYAMQQDPVNKDRLMLTVSDGASGAGRLFAKRLVMTSPSDFTWTNADGGAALDAALSSPTVSGFDYAYWPAPPTTRFDQSAYRFFANADSADVGAPLAAQDAPGALPAAGAPFRLRLALHIANVDLPLNGQGFKLQYAGRGDGTCAAPSNGVPAVYTDVTGATAIAFNNNPSVADNAALVPNAEDPRHGGHANREQTYEEANNSTNTVSAILRNQDGLWDFSLKDNGMTPGALYCLRLVKENGDALNEYYVFPELLLSATVYLNEVAPAEPVGQDWVELYNSGASTPSLYNWTLQYVDNTIDNGGTPQSLWTGAFGDAVGAASTFTITGLTLDGGNSYHVRLVDALGRLVGELQWPVMAAGQSFARVADGDPSYFEIDPTPTRGGPNAVSTDPVKISEIAYSGSVPRFIELYNASAASTFTLGGYSLRNSSGNLRGVFKLGRKIYPRDYALLDTASLDADGRTFFQAFGGGGLEPNGDYLTLENSTGAAVHTVTWQAGEGYTRYNYKAARVPVSAPAPANAEHSIVWTGSDTGSWATDFPAASTTTAASRNVNPVPSSSNTLHYPSGEEQLYLPRYFAPRLTLGEVSSPRGGNLLFFRVGGAADGNSPHIYRLQDIGISLSSLGQQATAQFGLAFPDQDGASLVAGAAYRVVLNSDNGAAAARQVYASSAVYDASVHGVAASTAAPYRMNDDSSAAVIKVSFFNNSPAGANAVELASASFRLLASDQATPLTQNAALALFDALALVRDSAGGVPGVYEPSVDLATAAWVPMGDITLDSGYTTFTVTQDGRSAASVPAYSTGTFFIVLKSTRSASEKAVSTFSVSFQPSSLLVREPVSGLYQGLAAGAAVLTSSVPLFAPALPPPGTTWPRALPPSVVSAAMPAQYINLGETSVSSSIYVTATDGRLRAFGTDGAVRWTYDSESLAAIRTSPLPVVSTDTPVLYLYFADDNGELYKVRDDPGAGVKIWKKNLGAPVRSGLVCSDLSCSGDAIYFATVDNKVHCRRKTDGEPCAGWQTPASVGGAMNGTLSVDSRGSVNSAWAALENGQVVSLRLDDAFSETAFTDLGGSPIRTSPFLDAYQAFPNNTLFFTSTNGKLYARVASNLSQPPAGWSDYEAGAAINSSPFMPVGSTHLFFGDDDGKLHKVSTQGVKADGWPCQFGAAIKGMPVILPGQYVGLSLGEDYVYFGTDDGYIHGVRADNCAPRAKWPVATGGPVREPPVVDTDLRSITFNSGDGKTYTLNIGP